ncbi:MAG: UDP-N-acetylmuramoyl-L-alanine--D-glutamate ligase [Fimbriimonadaceae bacterium]|nr:UDP-N-acetylmuramoyl-L-alanine--D-glutamate ligase [Fimbriimonadaceae bacterium]
MKVGIFGLGRSGVSSAKAAVKSGHKPIVFDEKPLSEKTQSIADELAHIGAEVEAGWKGSFQDYGLELLITSPGVPYYHPKLQEAVAAGLEVIGEIEFAYRISKAPIVAITGTNGKSTSTVMAHQIALGAGFDSVLCGNIYGSGYSEQPLTEAAANSTQNQLLVAEISSFQLEWVSQFRPVAAGITNITPDHLNRYPGGFDEYAQTKRNIFKAMHDSDVAVWHSSDSIVEPPKDQGLRILKYRRAWNDAFETSEALVILGCELSKPELPFGEDHNNLNAMFAGLLIAGVIGKLERGDLEKGLESLKSFKGLSHRMEWIGEAREILFVNNSMCTNPGAVIASSQSVRRPQRILMGGVNKGLDFTPVGDYLRTSKHHAYLYGQDATEIAAQLGGDCDVYKSIEEAFAAAVQDAQPGEAVMLAPGVASMDQFEDFRARGDRFRELAKEWLKK